ncbi:hypothetical protein BGZ89_007322 [Linnemannia elongata]|nr:hypothetical protein BGZ89_007322 [Linnemannia elongata]
MTRRKRRCKMRCYAGWTEAAQVYPGMVQFELLKMLPRVACVMSLNINTAAGHSHVLTPEVLLEPLPVTNTNTLDSDSGDGQDSKKSEITRKQWIVVPTLHTLEFVKHDVQGGEKRDMVMTLTRDLDK